MRKPLYQLAAEEMATNTAPNAPPRLPQARPYRDFLTPSFHRRFTNAAAVGLVICWGEAILMSEFGCKYTLLFTTMCISSADLNKCFGLGFLLGQLVYAPYCSSYHPLQSSSYGWRNYILENEPPLFPQRHYGNMLLVDIQYRHCFGI